MMNWYDSLRKEAINEISNSVRLNRFIYENEIEGSQMKWKQ